MAVDDADKLTIEDAQHMPRRSTIGGDTVEEHSLQDRIALDNHLATKANAGRSGAGILRQQFRHPRPGL